MMYITVYNLSININYRILAAELNYRFTIMSNWWFLITLYPGWIAWHRWMILSFHGSPDKSQISYFLLCNYIDLFIPVAIPESDRLFNHAQSHQLAGDKGHTILPGPLCVVKVVTCPVKGTITISFLFGKELF